MKRSATVLLTCLAVLSFALTACTSGAWVASGMLASPSSSSVTPSITSVARGVERVVAETGQSSPLASSASAASANATCPVTLPNGSIPPYNNPDPDSYGNGTLWTSFWPYNVVLMGPHNVEGDGSLSMKWSWTRGPGIVGKLVVQGRRLDQIAPPLRAEITPSYGDRGFQPTSLIFPTDGCWEVTGGVGSAKLTFVTLVLKS